MEESISKVKRVYLWLASSFSLPTLNFIPIEKGQFKLFKNLQYGTINSEAPVLFKEQTSDIN